MTPESISNVSGLAIIELTGHNPDRGHGMIDSVLEWLYYRQKLLGR